MLFNPHCFKLFKINIYVTDQVIEIKSHTTKSSFDFFVKATFEFVFQGYQIKYSMKYETSGIFCPVKKYLCSEDVLSIVFGHDPCSGF